MSLSLLRLHRDGGTLWLDAEATDLSVPAIPCQEAKDMWILFKDNRDAQGEKLIFLLGHLADTLGEHQQGCPALSENALDEVRQTMWKEI